MDVNYSDSMTQEEFNEMLRTAIEEHVTIECHNNGEHINVRLCFDGEEICNDSCESDV
jgi:hypothetical protein